MKGIILPTIIQRQMILKFFNHEPSGHWHEHLLSSFSQVINYQAQRVFLKHYKLACYMLLWKKFAVNSSMTYIQVFVFVICSCTRRIYTICMLIRTSEALLLGCIHGTGPRHWQRLCVSCVGGKLQTKCSTR